MTEADSILAGEGSSNRPDRIVKAFAPGICSSLKLGTKSQFKKDLAAANPLDAEERPERLETVLVHGLRVGWSLIRNNLRLRYIER
jgi:hypothetical protein